MVITYYGISCFKIQSGDTVLAFDPLSKKSGFKPPRFQADIVFVSSDDDNHNGFENIASKEKDSPPFLINGPGEYETRGVSVAGIRPSFLNTVYVLSFENLTLCHLGNFEEKELKSETQEFLADIDVLFAPADSVNIVKIINQIEPRIIIPMHYDNKKLKGFLKEIGREEVKAVEKFTFKKKDIMDKKGEVVVLKS